MNSRSQKNLSDLSDLSDHYAEANRWTSAIVTLLVLVSVCFTGCDLGTYNKRLNDTTPSSKMKKEMPEAGSSEKTEAEES